MTEIDKIRLDVTVNAFIFCEVCKALFTIVNVENDDGDLEFYVEPHNCENVRK